MVESGLSVAEYFQQVPRESTTEREVYDRRRQDYYAQGWIETRLSEGCYIHQV